MEYREYITPNDNEVIALSDYDSIQNAINLASEMGCNKVIVPKYNKRRGEFKWIIEKTVLIPGDMHLVLDNCYLCLADDVICNMFTNKNCNEAVGRTVDGTERNIIVEGRGNAVLDGGKYNGLSELNCDRENGPFVTSNCTMMFTNIDKFCISGLKFINQRYWAINFMFASNGRIRDIDFMANHSYIDENGNKIDYLSTEIPYRSICVINADGIDLRAGCHDIIVENITGFTQDDSVALTGLFGKSSERFGVKDKSYDIRNIIIRNINTSTLYANVRLLNMGGVKLYNILIDGIIDASKDFEGLKRGSSSVRIGDQHMYGSRHATSDEIYNISIRNVYSRAISPLDIVCNLKNISFDNIFSFDKE